MVDAGDAYLVTEESDVFHDAPSGLESKSDYDNDEVSVGRKAYKTDASEEEPRHKKKKKKKKSRSSRISGSYETGFINLEEKIDQEGLLEEEYIGLEEKIDQGDAGVLHDLVHEREKEVDYVEDKEDKERERREKKQRKKMEQERRKLEKTEHELEGQREVEHETEKPEKMGGELENHQQAVHQLERKKSEKKMGGQQLESQQEEVGYEKSKFETGGQELEGQQKVELENLLLRAQVQQLEEDRIKEREEQWSKEVAKMVTAKSGKQLYEQRGELREEMERLRRECSLADAVVKSINARSPQSMSRPDKDGGTIPPTGASTPFSAAVTGLRGILSPPQNIGNVLPAVNVTYESQPLPVPEHEVDEFDVTSKKHKNENGGEENAAPSPSDKSHEHASYAGAGVGYASASASSGLPQTENVVSRKEHDALLNQFSKQKELLNSWDDVVERIFPLMHQLLLLPESASAQRQASICEHLLRENRNRIGTPKAVLQIMESLTEALALWQQDTRDKIIMLEASLNAVKITNQEDLELVYDSMKRKTDRLAQYNNIEQENISLRDKLFVAERKMSLQLSLQAFGGINRKQPNPSTKRFPKHRMKRSPSPERFPSRRRDDMKPLYVIPDRPVRKSKSTVPAITQRIEQPSADECFDSDSIYR